MAYTIDKNNYVPFTQGVFDGYLYTTHSHDYSGILSVDNIYDNSRLGDTLVYTNELIPDLHWKMTGEFKGAYPSGNANFGVDKITRLSGSIIIPIDDLQLERIRNGSGAARLLDGGIVLIESVTNERYMSSDALDGYTKLSDISTEVI